MTLAGLQLVTTEVVAWFQRSGWSQGRFKCLTCFLGGQSQAFISKLSVVGIALLVVYHVCPGPKFQAVTISLAESSIVFQGMLRQSLLQATLCRSQLGLLFVH